MYTWMGRIGLLVCVCDNDAQRRDGRKGELAGEPGGAAQRGSGVFENSSPTFIVRVFF